MIRATLRRLARCTTAVALAAGLNAGPAAAEPAQARQVTEGVYLVEGARGETGPENLGRVGNVGFLVGPAGVVVIDTGVSHAHGRDLLAALRRITALPVDRIVITHAVQEFLYGTTAFVEAGGRPLTHAKSAELMRARCEHCLDNLRQILGDAAMAGTRLIVPDDIVDGDRTPLTAGGRTLELIHPGWASTPGDLMILDRATGVLFSGGVLTNRRVPDLRDGHLDAWVRAIDAIVALPIRAIVPGHGGPMQPADALETRRYLTELDRHVRALYARGLSLMEALDAADLPEFAAWDAYDALHRKNLQQRYLEVELEDLER